MGKKHILPVAAAFLFFAVALSVFAAPKACTDQPRETICHLGDEGPETLTVSACALPAHLNHGDTLGACGVTPPPNVTNITCEQAIDQGLLTATFENGTDNRTATISNLANQSFDVSLAAYTLNDTNAALYSNASGVVGANGTINLTTSVPACLYGLVALCGAPPAIPPETPELEDAIINVTFANENISCVGNGTNGTDGNGTNGGVNASLTLIAEPAFDPGVFLFTCAANGFTPTSYDYDFGDGSSVFNITANQTLHTYFFEGNYTATCAASNGTLALNASTNVNVTEVGIIIPE